MRSSTLLSDTTILHRMKNLYVMRRAEEDRHDDAMRAIACMEDEIRARCAHRDTEHQYGQYLPPSTFCLVCGAQIE